MEKRRFTRTQFSADGFLIVDSKRLVCDVVNLSLKGALVEIEEGPTVPVGSRVSFNLRLSGRQEIISAEAMCVHVDGTEVGIRFTSTDIDSFTHLRRLMELNTADAESIDRELGFLIDE